MTSEYLPSPTDFVAEHVAAYEATGGAEGALYKGIPCVILTTTGRRSAKLRKSPLVRVHDGSNYVAVGSMGGSPTDPAWVGNLVANPDVVLQDGEQIFELRARVTSGDERSRLWATAVSVFPAYAEYQTRCEREIPVVVLEARS